MCKRMKKPIGRSGPLQGGHCDDDCEGYRQAPHPGSLWPGETSDDFGYPVSEDGSVEVVETTPPVVPADQRPQEDPYVLPEHRGFAGVVGGQTCKAVLLRLGGAMEAVIEFTYPPPPDYREPIRKPVSVTAIDSTPSLETLQCRTFVRDLRLRSADHKWWFIYNSGRTQTPFDAYVYREIPSNPPVGEP